MGGQKIEFEVPEIGSTDGCKTTNLLLLHHHPCNPRSTKATQATQLNIVRAAVVVCATTREPPLLHRTTRTMSSSSKKRRRASTTSSQKTTKSAWKSNPHNPSAFPGSLPVNNEHVSKLRQHVHPHLQSYNFFLDDGIEAMIADLPDTEIDLPNETKLSVWVENVTIAPAMKKSNDTDNRLFPSECRERQIYYATDMTVRLGYRINDQEVPGTMARTYGGLPIMVGSNMCHLNGMSPEQLVRQKEEAHEFGGTFICNGIERVIRMLQVPRRNHPMAIERNAFSKKGPLFTTKGCTMRCGRPDMTSITLTLHYLNDGSVTVRFMMEKAEYFIPLVMLLKALKTSTTDREIYERAVGAAVGTSKESKNGATTNNAKNGAKSDMLDRQFVADRVELMLHDNKKLNLVSQEDHLSFIGAR